MNKLTKSDDIMAYISTPGMHPMINVDTTQMYDVGYILKKRLSSNYGHKAIYMHPSGAALYNSTITPFFMLQKEFGGVVILPDNNNKYIVFEPDRIGTLLLDELNDMYMYKNPKSPLIHGEYHLVQFKGVTKAFEMLRNLPNNLNFSGIDTPAMTERKHPNLYEAQDRVLQTLQRQDTSFHLLAGEVGVGKTHIASEYINDYLENNPNDKVLVVEPIPQIISKFKDLTHNNPNVTFTSDTNRLKDGNWDVIVFDEFHKLDGDETLQRFPLNNTYKHVLAMTGTVANTYPEQLWKVSRPFMVNTMIHEPMTLNDALMMGPYNNKNVPQLSSVRLQYEFYINNTLSPHICELKRSDIKELNVEETMPVNKFEASLELTPMDKAFYNLLKIRAKQLNMNVKEQLNILDHVLNTDQTEFVLHKSQIYGGNKPSYQLLTTEELDALRETDVHNTHDYYYLGKHDQPFVDKKLDFITKLHDKTNEKILVYMTSDNYGMRVSEDLTNMGYSAEYVDTSMVTAVDDINNSKADVVVFNVLPIREGIDLQANNIVWYNTPQSSGIDEQACGRITRLTSEKVDKNIYYLYHKTTLQENITKNIIKSNAVNNIALKRESKKIEDIQL